MNLPPHIHFIQRGWINSNAVLITGGDAPVLVDTGHPLDVDDTLRQVAAHTDPASIGLIVNTHCHWDHLGANNALRRLSDARTAASAATAAILARHDRRAMWLDYFGVDMPPVTVDITWQDGDVVRLGPYAFEVIATPGHAPDGIALFQPETGLLIAADALHDGDCGILNTAVHGDQVLDQAIATVARLQAVPITLAFPGHGGPIGDPAASLAALARRLAGFRARPEKMAMHLLRRVTMTTILLEQPISRNRFMAGALARPWPHDYAPRAGFADPEELLHHLLDDFICRQLITENETILTSAIPR